MTKGTLMGSLGLLSLLAGCAGAAPEPLRVRAADLGTLDEALVKTGRPLVIEIQQGEVIPLDIDVGGDLVAAPEGTSIPLTAKRTFFLRIDKDGLTTSLDGNTFGTKPRVPGSFRFGVSATRARGLRSEIVVRTPQP